jgi:putative ribosome biogenesis GTPase RsgA
MVQLVRSSSPDDAGALGALAQQLAQALRASRLTVVVGAAGVGKSTLLSGVLPLLRRRAIDAAQPRCR